MGSHIYLSRCCTRQKIPEKLYRQEAIDVLISHNLKVVKLSSGKSLHHSVDAGDRGTVEYDYSSTNITGAIYTPIEASIHPILVS